MNHVQQTIFYLSVIILNFSALLAGITKQQFSLNTAPLQFKGQTYPSIKGTNVTCIYQPTQNSTQIQCSDRTVYYPGSNDPSHDIFLTITQEQLDAFQGATLPPLIASHYLGSLHGLYFFGFPPHSIGYNFSLHSNRPSEINLLNIVSLNTHPLRIGNKQYTSIKQPTTSCAVAYQYEDPTKRQWQIVCTDGSYYHTEEETISTTDILEPRATIAVVQDPVKAPAGFSAYLGSFHAPTANNQAQTWYAFTGQ